MGVRGEPKRETPGETVEKLEALARESFASEASLVVARYRADPTIEGARLVDILRFVGLASTLPVDHPLHP